MGICIDVNCPDDDNVAVLHSEYLTVAEEVAEIDDDRVVLDEAVELPVLVFVLEPLIEAETVAV